MKKILIGGGSWGCGEWGFNSKNEYDILHTGLTQYLLDDGFDVTNVSKGGISNKDSITMIINELKNDDYDHIIWFQTDPYRDLRPFNNFCDQLQDYDNFRALGVNLLNKSYARLNQLNVKIICLGGCTKLDPSIKNYSNLISGVTSIIELLLPGFNAPEVWASDWVHTLGRPGIVHSRPSLEVLDRLTVSKRQQDKLLEFPKLFYPDGGHPNRTGHLILYNFIKGEFLNESN